MTDSLTNPSLANTGPVGERETSAAALDVRRLSHRYGERQALDDVTICIPPSTFAVLLGLNGAGKSTLFSLATRLFNAQSGDIRIFGHDLRHEPGAALKMLGVVFQARTLDLDLSILQNLQYHAALHGMSGREARARASELLERIGLGSRARDKARNLSGGQIRRVEIARALLHRPRLLLLDEPTVGLDIEARAAILRYVRSLVATEGISVLWATHLIDEVVDSDTVIVLHRGKVLAEGIAADVAKKAGGGSMRDAFARVMNVSTFES